MRGLANNYSYLHDPKEPKIVKDKKKRELIERQAAGTVEPGGKMSQNRAINKLFESKKAFQNTFSGPLEAELDDDKLKEFSLTL